ncbi:ATP-binding protein [Mycoplasmopsis citelli]|uniref:AAA family ATPase n=1 Tax=Mycoplasmopsis citelli TaxID=171281 RepID=UPI002114DB29|nr:AAA family ATPase [Mycoplasmopsis citelli]UUD36419.1 ATP-binding protein [Mycoplasmopsis citelli]
MQKMKLKRTRIFNFKSIKNSGWIDFDDITTLVGLNGAGKSNVLLALWKFNPAKDGKIKLADDAPVSQLVEINKSHKKPVFIECEFEIIDNNLLTKFSKEYKEPVENIKKIRVSKDFNNNYEIKFADLEYKRQEIESKYKKLTNDYVDIITSSKIEKDTETDDQILYKLIEFQKLDNIKLNSVQNLIKNLINLKNNDKTNWFIKDEINNFITKIKNIKNSYINDSDKILNDVLPYIPKFVYYSNYENLDSEIYLPNLIENLRRNDLNVFNKSKTRTIKALFEYIGIKPEEVLNIVTDTNDIHREDSEKRKEIIALLQSASSNLTEKFNEWWKQGSYKFEFHIIGKHFIIYVSDTEKVESIILENRSTGLQWFFSFFIVFLVENEKSHSDSIILLDEAGLSLHPVAQKNLIAFFKQLSSKNQIIHTTHSPFLVDTNNISSARIVYLDKGGYTVVTKELNKIQKANKNKSIFPIHTALGLSVSDVLLQGCNLVIVEGISDQYYLTAIKQYLIKNKLLNPVKEILFIPSWGAKNVSSISSFLSLNEGLPKVILDSDKAGKDFREKLERKLYKECKKNILDIYQISKIEDSEVEDLFPLEFFEEIISKYIKKANNDFDFKRDFKKQKIFSKSLEFNIDKKLLDDESKFEFAKYISRFLREKEQIVPDEYIDMWINLFDFIEKSTN